MRYFLPALVLCALASLAAEDAPRQLDPAKPADAVQIVAQVAAQVPLKLAESQALLAALQTLQALAVPPTAPSPAPKPEGAKP